MQPITKLSKKKFQKKKGLFLIDDARDDDTKKPEDKKESKKPEAPKPPETPKTEATTTNEDKRKWLNKGTPDFDYCKKRIADGVTIETIEKTFRLSKEVKDLLTAK